MGYNPVQPDARPAVPLVRDAPAPRPGGRAGRRGRPGRAGRRPARRRRGREAGLFRPLREPEDRGRSWPRTARSSRTSATLARERLSSGTATPAGRAPGRGARQRTRPGAASTSAGDRDRPAALARQLHVSPETDLQDPPAICRVARSPTEFERLYRLAIAARPELQGRLAAVARDEQAVELARKRFYPNVTLGLDLHGHGEDQRPDPAGRGRHPNVGLFVGFNLPSTAEVPGRGLRGAGPTIADAEALRGPARRDLSSEIKDFMVQAKAQRDVLDLLRDQASCPGPKTVLRTRPERLREAATSDFMRRS